MLTIMDWGSACRALSWLWLCVSVGVYSTTSRGVLIAREWNVVVVIVVKVTHRIDHNCIFMYLSSCKCGTLIDCDTQHMHWSAFSLSPLKRYPIHPTPIVVVTVRFENNNSISTEMQALAQLLTLHTHTLAMCAFWIYRKHDSKQDCSAPHINTIDARPQQWTTNIRHQLRLPNIDAVRYLSPRLSS